MNTNQPPSPDLRGELPTPNIENDLCCDIMPSVREELATLQRELSAALADSVALRAALEQIRKYDSEALRETMLIWIHSVATEALATPTPGASLLDALAKAAEALRQSVDDGTATVTTKNALDLLAPFIASTEKGAR